MRLIFAFAAMLLLHCSYAEENGWSWGDKKEAQQETEQLSDQTVQQLDELLASASEYADQYALESTQQNATEVDKVVDEILVSNRQGRNLNGFDEVYTDPNVQEALQKGDDGEARNIIKERLCHLGLMQCDEQVQEKRPYISPEELIYAQPVAINPVGRPIPTIPIKGVRGGYGPPKPIPFPPQGGPLNKFGPPPPKFGPPQKFGPPGPPKLGPPPYAPNKPPRRGYGPPPSKPFYGPSGTKPFLDGEIYEGAEFSKPPPGAEIYERPYEFEQGVFQSNYNKDKKVELVLNAQGGSAHASVSTVSPTGLQEHIHHHYHHNLEGASKVPTVVVNPVPVAAVSAASTSESLLSNSFGSSHLVKPLTSSGFSPITSGSFGESHGLTVGGSNGFSGSGSLTNTGSSFGAVNSYGQTIGSSGFGSGSYGGQSIASYGGGSTGLNAFASKPVYENFGAQNFGSNSFGTSVGSYGNTGLYKKELSLNSGNSNYLQSNYADKYQGLESAKRENYDCVCVPYDQCPSHDVIGRKDDLYLPLDPRNLKSDIEAIVDEERVITDGNGTMTVVRIPKNANLNETLESDKAEHRNVEESKKVSKREASVDQKEDKDTKIEPRQAYFGGNFGGRPSTCGPRHVCCRRPLRPHVPNGGYRNQCGTRHSQGINGRIKNPVYVDGDSEFGEYPWQVAILKKDPKESVYVCGGTLIDPLHIITAAHCVKTYTGYDLRVRLGEWDVNHDVEFFPYIERDITTINVHPEFYAGTLYNDLAILRMDKPVDFSKHPHISPACLPSLRDDYTGTRCWTTGWGKDAFGDFGKYQNILKEVDVPIVGHAQCQRQLQQTRLGYEFQLHPGFVCAGGEEGKDACKGDGGGPMVCERGGTWQVVGVVSWGIGCGQSGVPGVYVKVAHYLDWIRQITQRF